MQVDALKVCVRDQVALRVVDATAAADRKIVGPTDVTKPVGLA
jgi:hypothetical protein